MIRFLHKMQKRKGIKCETKLVQVQKKYSFFFSSNVSFLSPGARFVLFPAFAIMLV